MSKAKVAFYDVHGFEKEYYKNEDFDFMFTESSLNSQTALMSQGFKAVCSFVNDKVDSKCLKVLSTLDVELIALRSAGFNHVDLKAAAELNIKITRVPRYSPESIAEFALLQILCLSRKIHRSYQRTRELNFSLDGLVGSTIHGKKVGIIGTGEIGESLVRLLKGFQCEILAYDLVPKANLGIKYVSQDELISESDIISLNVPLTVKTKHLLNENEIAKMKKGVLIVNTGRGALIESKALIRGIKSKKIGGAALDVYEEEENYFFEDFSNSGIEDDILARLVSFPNVIVTSHQGFLTDTSLLEISASVLKSLKQWEQKKHLTEEVKYEKL